jgi:hypothetical protein
MSRPVFSLFSESSSSTILACAHSARDDFTPRLDALILLGDMGFLLGLANWNEINSQTSATLMAVP